MSATESSSHEHQFKTIKKMGRFVKAVCTICGARRFMLIREDKDDTGGSSRK